MYANRNSEPIKAYLKIQKFIQYPNCSFAEKCCMMQTTGPRNPFESGGLRIQMKQVMTEDERRMDRFDAMISEYLRRNRKTVEYLAERVGCDPSSLWRYRRRVLYFRKMPLQVLAGCMRMANASNDTIRDILGL